MDQKTKLMFARMVDEKHVFTYKKLVVPVQMRSIYWKYFGFPATDQGDILTKVKIVCVLCKTQIAYNRNTSNLRMHLQNKHARELMELETTTPPRRPGIDNKEKRAQKKAKAKASIPSFIYATAADGDVQIDGDIQFITDPNISLQNLDDDTSSSQNVRVVLKPSQSSNGTPNFTVVVPEESTSQHAQNEVVDSKTLSDAITNFIVQDLQSPDVVEGKGFQHLVAILRSPCEIPSKVKLEAEVLPHIYEIYRNEVCREVSEAASVGLSLEEWQSLCGLQFVTVTAHFQQGEELVARVLCTLQCWPCWSTTEWGIALDNMLSEWGLQPDSVTAVVAATQQQELLKALSEREVVVVPCLVHSLQISTSSCFELPVVQEILKKCRGLVGRLVQLVQTGQTTHFQDMLQGQDIRSDHPGVWTTTYSMLEQLLLRRALLATVLETAEVLDADKLLLSSEEWKVVEDLVSVLEPFKVTMMTLSEERAPLISLLKPLLGQLHSSHLCTKDTDSPIARKLKQTLSDALNERYSDPAVNFLLQTATVLDPRFKLLPYTTENTSKTAILDSVKEMLVKVVVKEKLKADDVREESAEKKRRLTGMEMLLGTLCPSPTKAPAEERASMELSQYQTEPPAPLDACPLRWWLSASSKCPHLAQLARGYTCCPASATPPHRIPPDAQVLFNAKRTALAPELVDRMLFLHTNYSVVG